MEAFTALNPGNIQRKNWAPAGTAWAEASAPAAPAAEPEELSNPVSVQGELQTRPGDEFAGKAANADLADGWAALVTGGPSLQEILGIQGGGAMPEAQAPVEEESGQDAQPGEAETGSTAPVVKAAELTSGSSRAFPLNVEDNARNRALKAEYNQANKNLEDARRYSTFSGNGQRTTCHEEGDGLTYERYEDGRMTITNNHKSIYVDKPKYDNLEYSIDEAGNLTKKMTDDKGTRSFTAMADGSFVERDGNGETVGNLPPDRGMRDYDRLASEWGSSYDKDGKKSPLSGEQKYTMTTALSGFDRETLEGLRKSGVRLEAWDYRAPRLPGDESGSSAGYYAVDESTVVINQDKLKGGVTTFTADVIRHELGHAIDDQLLPPQKELPAGEKDPVFLSKTDGKVEKSLGNYQQRTQESDGAFWTSYGKQDVREYFAEGVSAYTAQGEKRERFRNADPEFFSYVEQKMQTAREQGAQLSSLVP